MGNMTRKQAYEKLDDLMERDLLDYNVWKDGSSDDDILLVEWMSVSVRDEIVRMLDDADILWDYAELYAIDTETGRAYESVVYHGCTDYITTEDDVIGRDRVDEWSDEERARFIEEHYLDNPDNALPCWFDVPDDRYEYVSCDFEAGWYGRYDDPKEILKKARERGEHIFFKIADSQPFATKFCVYRKKENDGV